MRKSSTGQFLLGLIAIGALVVFSRSGHMPTVPTPRPSASSNTAQWQVYFSPRGGCTEAVVQTLSQARQTVRVQAYSFTSAPIAKAVVDAKKRGVDVQVLLDSSQKNERYSSADFLVRMGVKTYIDDAHAIAHNKVMIIDGKTVITGSFNFTKSAEERNAENLLVIRDSKLASAYADNWQQHLHHAEAYRGK